LSPHRSEIVRLTRAVEFSASLSYAHPDLTPEENRHRFGPKASRHGHNYRLEVTLRGQPDPLTGMVMDLKYLGELLEREIMVRFDHRDLVDDTDLFGKRIPTPENVALVIAELLRRTLPAGMLDRVRLHQDEDTFVDVIEDDPGEAPWSR
jgi:6-pyruvoyltetrahydropterin/6-carboxytetrahydropterin synthase